MGFTGGQGALALPLSLGCRFLTKKNGARGGTTNFDRGCVFLHTVLPSRKPAKCIRMPLVCPFARMRLCQSGLKLACHTRDVCRTDYPSRLISQERRIILIVITSERERETRTASRQAKGLFRAAPLISPPQGEKAWVVNVFSLSPSAQSFLPALESVRLDGKKGPLLAPGHRL